MREFLDTDTHPDYQEGNCWHEIGRICAWGIVVGVFLACVGITAGVLARHWGWV